MSHSRTALTVPLLDNNPSSLLSWLTINEDSIIAHWVTDHKVIDLFSKAFIECILVQWFSESYSLQTLDTYLSQFTSGSYTEPPKKETIYTLKQCTCAHINVCTHKLGTRTQPLSHTQIKKPWHVHILIMLRCPLCTIKKRCDRYSRRIQFHLVVLSMFTVYLCASVRAWTQRAACVNKPCVNPQSETERKEKEELE